MIYRTNSRRKFIGRSLCAGTVILGGGLVLDSCDSKKSAQEDKENAFSGDCNDLSAVSESEIKKRENFGYVKESPMEDEQCSNCGLYIPSGIDKDCGKCMLFEGPVHASGYCTYWAPQV